jgi:hypothetical protein
MQVTASENNGKDAKSIVEPMDSSQWKSKLSIPRILLFSLSVVSLVIGAAAATAHYLRSIGMLALVYLVESDGLAA